MASFFKTVAVTAAALLLACGAEAQETTTTTTSSSPSACATVLKPSYSAPVVADGWKAQLIATDLTRPRGLTFDSKGALLVIESGVGLKHLTLADNGGTCLSVKTSKTIIADKDLNHGLDLSADGRTLYVSSASTVFSYAYDPDSVSATSPTRLVTNMSHPSGRGHVTRTLLLSRKSPSLLLVSRGSASNLDDPDLTESGGVSQIRVFNISDASSLPYDYTTGGALLARGLRNSVGVAEHPSTGDIWSVENSADNIARGGSDVHEDNPGEELNSHGPAAGGSSSSNNNTSNNNYGYPVCFALWSPSSSSTFSRLPVGAQFALDPADDAQCAAMAAPRLTFPAHTAPLDIKFSPPTTTTTGNGSVEEAFVTFHGSWNRAQPAGYKLSVLSFSAATGEPAAERDSTDALRDVMSAPDVGACGGGSGGECMRPVGMAFDGAGRLWVSSDATGEVWVVMRGEGGQAGGGGGGGDGGEGGKSAAGGRMGSGRGWVAMGVTVGVVVVGGWVFGR